MPRASMIVLASLVLSLALAACAERTNVNKPPASCPCSTPSSPRR